MRAPFDGCRLDGCGWCKGWLEGGSNEMGAGRKERLYLCLGFLAAEDFAWVVFLERPRVNVRLCI